MLIVSSNSNVCSEALGDWPPMTLQRPDSGGLSAAERDVWQTVGGAGAPQVRSLEEALPKSGFWSHLYLVDRAPCSQYDILRQMERPESPWACLALEGQGFHGQRQRSWHACRGNLHLSVSVPLNLPHDTGSLAWTMLPAVAVARVLHQLGAPGLPHCGIKWVNDILWDGQKLSGVLSSLSTRNNRVVQGTLGIGLNIFVNPDLETSSLTGGTTCLARHLAPEQVSHGKVLHLLLQTLAGLIQKFSQGRGQDIGRAYRQSSLILGRQVRVVSDPVDGESRLMATGRVLEIGPDLGLVLDSQDEIIHNGRLYFVD